MKHSKFYILLILISLSKLAFSQHIIKTREASNIYCEIIKLGKESVSFRYLKQSKYYTIDRTQIGSIDFFGVDVDLIYENIKLDKPYIIEGLRMNDVLEYKNKRERDGLFILRDNIKVLQVSDEVIYYVQYLNNSYVLDTITFQEVESIEYSDETLNYIIKSRPNTDGDKIITRYGEVIDCYIYEFGAKTVRYSKEKLDDDVIVFNNETLKSEYLEKSGLKILSYSDIIKVQEIGEAYYLPAVELKADIENNQVRAKSMFQPNIKLDFFGSRGSLLSESPYFRNRSEMDGKKTQDEPTDEFRNYNIIGARVSLQLKKNVYASLGYKKVFSNTARTNSYVLNTTTLDEEEQSVNYQNNISIIEFGLGVHTKNLYSNIKMGRISAENKFILQEVSYANLRPTDETKIEGYYTSKNKISLGVDLGYELSLKNFSVIPHVGYERIPLSTEEVVITSKETDNPKYDDLEERMSHPTFDALNLFYVPVSNTISLFEYGIILRYSLR